MSEGAYSGGGDKSGRKKIVNKSAMVNCHGAFEYDINKAFCGKLNY